MSVLRARGYDKPVYLHGALVHLCRLYEDYGIELGPWRAVSEVDRRGLRGEIVLCPPSALADRWSRAFPDPLPGLASGWMRVRQRARQRGIELPLVISDHADWHGLTQTIDDCGAGTILVTHGREEGLVHFARARGLRAAALSLPERGEDAS
jgi:putative mRNA 3-end processing factor